MSTTAVSPDSAGARVAAERIWRECGLPADALALLDLEGTPTLPSSFQVGVAAQSSIACAALAAAEIGRLCSGEAQRVGVSMVEAERECTGYFTLDGRAPEAWAPLSGLYRCRDGHVRIHANFAHHRDGVLKLLGIPGDPAACSKERLAAALADWPAEAFETAAAEAGLVVAAARSFGAWDAHPQAAAVAGLPLLTIERIGDAPALPLPKLARDALPLFGLRVLDLTRILAGPVCGRTLAAYGADVLLVNSPRLPNIEAIADTSRGKRSALLDLGEAAGRARLSELLADARVFVQGYRPGGLDALGFGPERAAAVRPGIVYVSLSAYGHEGPWSARRGFDSLVQTATGFNVAEAEAAGVEAPKPLPVQILDYASGFLMAFAAEVALLRQAAEGGSWHVRVSLAQTARWLRGLGRIDAGFARPRVDVRAHLAAYPCDFGALRALPHAARFARTPARWKHASAPPGTARPEWLEGEG